MLRCTRRLVVSGGALDWMLYLIGNDLYTDAFCNVVLRSGQRSRVEGMKLVKAQVKNYRSIINSGPFDIERTKTILVGPNEAGKTVLLRGLQQLNPPDDAPKFEALRDYPRAHYNDIITGRVDPAKTDVVIGYFILDEYDLAAVPSDFRNAIYIVGRRLDNSRWHHLEGGPRPKLLAEVKSELQHLASHMDQNAGSSSEDASPIKRQVQSLPHSFRRGLTTAPSVASWQPT